MNSTRIYNEAFLQYMYTKHDKTEEKYTNNQQEMSKVQSNAVNDNTNTSNYAITITLYTHEHVPNFTFIQHTYISRISIAPLPPDARYDTRPQCR